MQRTYAWLVLLFGVAAVSLPLALGQAPPAAPPPADNPQLPIPRRVGPTGDPAADNPLELIEVRDVPLFDAMRLLSQQSGLRIFPSPTAGKVPVSVYLRDVPALTAVATVTQAHGLIYRRDATTGIVSIFTPTEHQRDLADFREEQTQVFTLLYPNALGVA